VTKSVMLAADSIGHDNIADFRGLARLIGQIRNKGAWICTRNCKLTWGETENFFDSLTASVQTRHALPPTGMAKDKKYPITFKGPSPLLKEEGWQ
jgi:hypothetical protein